MFDINGDFRHAHDLEDGLWDGHGYDCPTPVDPCICEDGEDTTLSSLLYMFEQEDYDDDWIDLATYHAGR